MGTSYSPAPDEVAALVQQRLRKSHPDLWGVSVRVGVLMAWNPDAPAVKHGGYPCNATIKVVSHKDRVTKGYDAELVIDQLCWDGFRPKQRLALIAHELRHLELVLKLDKETGQQRVQLDDGGRPKLKTRPGDWNAGDGFADVVAEFGEDAVEYHNLKNCWRRADEAKEEGPSLPGPTLLDGVEVVTDGGEVISKAGADGFTKLPPGAFGTDPSLSLSFRLGNQFKERANGHEAPAGPGSQAQPAGDGEGEDGDDPDDPDRTPIYNPDDDREPIADGDARYYRERDDEARNNVDSPAEIARDYGR